MVAKRVASYAGPIPAAPKFGQDLEGQGGPEAFAIKELVAPEIRVWRVGSAFHANIPRSVVRQPPVIEHRPPHDDGRLDRNQLLDLALNVLGLFAPPEGAAPKDFNRIKCFRGYCSTFAARHHEQFTRDFIEGLVPDGGTIATAEIRVWIERRLVEDPNTFTKALDGGRVALSA